jgi:putative ABC transport system permease protein
MHNNLIEGEFLEESDTDSILLGVGIAGADIEGSTEYAISLKTVHAGDTVTVKMIDGKSYDLKVKGIFKNTFVFSDRKAYVSNKTAEKYLPTIAGRASAIYVKAKDGVNEADLGSELIKINKELKYQTADDMGSGINEQISAFDILYRIIEIFSLAVAAITVFIVTYVELINRRKQIGIERAIGIKPSAIIGMYLIKSLIFAVIGTIVGVVIFLGVAVPLIDKYPFNFPYGEVVLHIDNANMWKNGFILVGVSFVSALIPAIQSIRVKILDAIWGAQ